MSFETEIDWLHPEKTVKKGGMTFAIHLDAGYEVRIARLGLHHET